MAIAPKYPPRRSCNLRTGTHVIVTQSFEVAGVRFVEDEELIFKREMLDVYDDCDIWIFEIPESTGVERSLPDDNLMKDFKKLCPERAISGYGKYANPKNWISCFRILI